LFELSYDRKGTGLVWSGQEAHFEAREIETSARSVPRRRLIGSRLSIILGIETSCDECSAAVVRYEAGDSPRVLGISTFSQIKIHEPYGGVVPEIASRNHLETINPMIERALLAADLSVRDMDAIAVTNRPGLVGALLVGVAAAKALAYATRKPLIAIHHLEGHAASLFLDQETIRPRDLALPLLLAIVSGGHTNL
jgi:N6-L-threonylcarbamoyladenine synthase